MGMINDHMLIGGLPWPLIVKNGKVGIGTTNPGYKLEISGGHMLLGTNIYPHLALRDTSYWLGVKTGNPFGIADPLIINSHDTRSIVFSRGATFTDAGITGGVASMVIEPTNGNVVIGTAAPEGALHVTGSNADTATIKGASLGISGDFSSLELKGTSSTLGGGFIDFGYPNNDYVGRIIYFNDSGLMRFTVGGIETMAIKGGNVGIGTTSPDGQFSQGLANGQQISCKSLTELTTIEAAATTDTAIQIPANVIVKAVSVRVTVAIPTAASFTVKGATSATAFNTAAVSTAVDTTNKGNLNCPYNNGAAQTIRITPDQTPADNSGRVRVTIWYEDSIPPTS